jgi:tRNA threonylcarbamoyl adenosine modification protein YeaZ
VRTLIIESATEACSVALFEDGGDCPALLAGMSEVIGRGHAERLVPMIAELPEKGHADRVVVSLGPGSFTGVRIGLAAARALGLAWRAEVRGYPTLALVASHARQSRSLPVTVCMAGGHGEWFIQNFAADGWPEDKARSLGPDQSAAACRHSVIVGSRAADLAALVGPDRVAIDLLPDARRFDLPQALLMSDLAPLYGRPPDAKLPA